MTRKAGAVSEETMKKLIDAAIVEFSSEGFQNASLRKICAEAGVTTGALYFFFKDKQDLFEHIISNFTEKLLQIMERHYEIELLAPHDAIFDGESEDWKAAEDVLHLYFSNKTIGEIILNNLQNPAVELFFNQLTELMDKQGEILMSSESLIGSSEKKFDPFIAHWFSHIQIDSILQVLLHGFNEEQAMKQCRTIVRCLRDGSTGLFLEANGEKK